MNEQNIIVEITVVVKANGVVIPDAKVKVQSVTIGNITIPNIPVK